MKQKPNNVDFTSFCNQIATVVAEAAEKHVHESQIVAQVSVKGAYLNIHLKSEYLARIVPEINQEESSFLAPRAPKDETVMIEYSQPNTHKTFHVGHMRNAALGNSLVKIFEYSGHKVHAVNYIGDVGAHIAKCLWYYLYYELKTDVESFEQVQGVTEEWMVQTLEKYRPQGMPHVEWLGEMYQKGCDQLDMTRWTSLPHPGFVSAKVLSI